MCGLAGAFDLQGLREFPTHRLEAMGLALSHRGPDGRGLHREPGLAMVHSRLALVDPRGGSQPMASNKWLVTVNGERFDHKAERAKLESTGATFRTNSDTEVWLHALGAHGAAAFEGATGQFAVAAFERTARTLFLARDRFGICPLFATVTDGWLLWGSTMASLLASGLVARRVDLRALDHHLTFLGASPRRTLIENVSPIEPGWSWQAELGAPPQRRRFATVSFPASGAERVADTPRGEQALIDELEEGLKHAVRQRLDADAPVGLYLSGGVDSSLLCAIAANQAGRDRLTAFSIGLEGVGLDESDPARRTAQHLGLRHELLSVTRRTLAELFPEVVRHAEAPVLDHADISLLALSRRVRSLGFKAVLTGEGADEAFGGYPWDVAAARLRRAGASLPRLAGNVLRGIAGSTGRRALRAGHAFESTPLAAVLELMASARSRFVSASVTEALGDWFPSDDHDVALDDLHPFNAGLSADFRVLLSGHLLVDKGDRMAMANGVEPRFPFLDEAFLRSALSLHPTLKVRPGADKWILRQLAARWLPNDVALRPKHMFRAEPVIHEHDRPPWVDELLSEASLERTGYFDVTRVGAALRQPMVSWAPRRGLEQAGMTGVVSTQLWHHLFLGGELCSLPVAKPEVLEPLGNGERFGRR